MNIYAFGPIATVLDAAYGVLTSLTLFVHPLAGSAAGAVAVVLLTLLVRAVLIPVGVSQARADRTRRRLAPRIAELQHRYRTNPELLRRKMTELYAAESASPLAGCLPLLAQAPVLSIVYGLFIQPTINAHPNALLSATLLGVPLGSRLPGILSAGSLTPGAATVFGAVIVLIAAVAYCSRRLLRQAAPPTASPGNPALAGVLSFAPFGTALAAAFVPLAAALYLLVTVAWTLAERLTLRRLLDPPPPQPPAPPRE